MGVVALLAGMGLGAPLSAQHVEDPVVPRGALLFQVGGAFHQAPGAFGEDGRSPFGGPFFTPVDTEAFSAFRPLEEALQELGGGPAFPVRLGTIRGRFEVNEQELPIRVGYGLMERLSLSVTVPFVRRRTDAHLFLDGGGANLGLSPGSQARAAFRSGGLEALEQLRGRVEQVCLESGEDSEGCRSGRETEARVAGFLDLLDSVWGEGTPFPLEGSDLGLTLADRWTGMREELFAWGAEGAVELPLASTALDDAFFRREVVGPVWGSGGFPLETPEAFLLLGDVEAHLGIGLLRLAPEGMRPGIRSAVEATARFATGTADSLSLVTPLEPPRGYAGGGVRWVTDLTAAEGRAGLLVTLDWSTFLDGEVVLLATDRARPWEAATRREVVTGAPGDRIRFGITPRWAVTPGLFLGGGYEWVHGGEGRWTTASGDAVRSAPGVTQHLGVVELRLAGWSAPLLEELRFPVELSARGSWALSGTAGSPRDRRVEVGARVLRRR